MAITVIQENTGAKDKFTIIRIEIGQITIIRFLIAKNENDMFSESVVNRNTI